MKTHVDGLRVRVALAAACLAAAAVPAAGDTRYRDEHNAFSLELPQGWSVAGTDYPHVARFETDRCPPGSTAAGRCKEFVVVTRGLARESETSAERYRERVAAYRTNKLMALRGEGEITIDGERVGWFVLDYRHPLGKMRLFSVFVVRGRSWYEFTGWAARETFEGMEPTYRRMAASLRFH